jgi:O-antigen/teichoic acid export membrane protein
MITWTKQQLYSFLRWTERYTKTDMVYMAASNFWIVAPRFVVLATGMLLTVGFANLLAPEIYGTYKYVIAASGFITAFSLNAMGQSVMRSVAQGNVNIVPGLIRTSMHWSLPASIITLCVSAYYFGHANFPLGFGFLFIAVSNVLVNGYGLSKSVLVAKGDFKRNTVFGLPRAMAAVLVVLLTLVITRNLIWILLAYFLTNIYLAWSQYVYSVKHLHIHESDEGLKEAVSFGKHMSVLGFFMLISGQIDQLLLFHFTGAAQLAIYTLALAPVQEGRNLLVNFSTIIFPKLARKTKEEIRISLPLRLKQITILSIIATIGYIVLVPLLFTYLFPKYLVSITISQILALTILFQGKGVIESLLIAHGEIKKRYAAILTSQAIEFVFYCTLIPMYGLWGAAWATVLAEAGAAATLYVMYRRF